MHMQCITVTTVHRHSYLHNYSHCNNIFLSKLKMYTTHYYGISSETSILAFPLLDKGVVFNHSNSLLT